MGEPSAVLSPSSGKQGWAALTHRCGRPKSRLVVWISKDIFSSDRGAGGRAVSVTCHEAEQVRKAAWVLPGP